MDKYYGIMKKGKPHVWEYQTRKCYTLLFKKGRRLLCHDTKADGDKGDAFPRGHDISTLKSSCERVHA